MSIRATAQSAQYYAVISYNTSSTMTTQPITIDTVNNGIVANLQLDTTDAFNSAIQSVCPGTALGKYYFLNFPYQYVNNNSQITSESGSTLSLNLNLNIFDNGSQVNTNTLSNQQSNWKITWYEQNIGNNDEGWGTSSVICWSKPITSASTWTYSTANFQNGSIYRVRCLITESTGQMYSNWYYFGAIPQLKIGWMYDTNN